MATHSSILAWKFPWTEEPVGCSPWGCKELDTTEHEHTKQTHRHREQTWDCQGEEGKKRDGLGVWG